jgi:hypothetical protein
VVRKNNPALGGRGSLGRLAVGAALLSALARLLGLLTRLLARLLVLLTGLVTLLPALARLLSLLTRLLARLLVLLTGLVTLLPALARLLSLLTGLLARLLVLLAGLVALLSTLVRIVHLLNSMGRIARRPNRSRRGSFRLLEQFKNSGKVAILNQGRSLGCAKLFCNNIGRVEMWRGGGRSNIYVAAPFVWRCLIDGSPKAR